MNTKTKILYTIEATIDGEDAYYNEETGHWWAYWGLSGGTLYSTQEEAETIAKAIPRPTSILAIDGNDSERLYYIYVVKILHPEPLPQVSKLISQAYKIRYTERLKN